MMKRLLLTALLIGFTGLLYSGNVLSVVTSTSDFADIASQIGGDRVKVTSLTGGKFDLHSIEPRPSMVMAVRNADLVVRIGMDLDLWCNSLIDASKNSRVLSGNAGNLDVSAGIEKLEVPVGKVDMGMGDVHIYGNPHYWLDPENGLIIAGEIRDRLCQLVPDAKDYFTKNFDSYTNRLTASIRRWDEQMKPYRGLKVITYHKSLPYFAKRFGLVVADNLEPKPGIPPTPAHLKEIEEKVKNEKIGLILVENYYNADAAETVARNTGAHVARIVSSAGGAPEVKTYEGVFDYDIAKILGQMK